ncbi:alpha/beta fold hydrolase [Pseudooceanicola sp. C21-150M6]|uniref:alpha/beta fold hydrolase n=1 Tax=Pseudooceanicola sp. C21-150M6 TaxID=3434355 RepID=UPI003D7FA897
MSYPVRNDGGQSWREAGSGDPLVLVHGIGGTTANWLPVIGPLAGAHHVHAWAFPGYEGARALPMEAPMAEDYADRLLAFLDARGIGQAHVVGHSLGAIVVAALARMAPDRVTRASYVCPVIGAGHLPLEQRSQMRQGRVSEITGDGMAAFAEARTGSIIGPSASPEQVAEIIATMAGIPAAAYLQAWEMLCGSSILPMLVPGAAQVAGGDVDPVAPVAAVTQMAEALSVDPVFWPGIGHFPTHEARDALLAFIRRA